MTLENWNAQHIDRYATALANGLHDSECEQRERSSLCHCRKRLRLAEGRTEPPTLVYQVPVCDGCWKDVDFDGDTWACPRCHVTFGLDEYDEPGKFNDDYGDDIGGERWGERLIVLTEDDR